MADFRKCLLAFAVLALLSSFAVPAYAQLNPALQCTFNAAVTPTVRAEGLAELVGDIVLNCTGGTPTPPNQQVPAANITVFLSTNLTSRITSSPFTEVLMLVDEPHSASNPSIPLTPCDPTGVTLGICTLYGAPATGTAGNPAPGVAPGLGGYGTYNPGVSSPTGTSRVNVFQARLTGTNQVTFFGVPIDPPGTAGTRIIRITNLRGNANQLGVSSTLVPTQIVANISVSPPNLLPLNNPQQTVAFVARGLTTSVRDATSFVQCISANPDIAGDPTKALNSSPQFAIRFDEGFPSAWKERNIAVHLANTAVASSSSTGGFLTPSYPNDLAQDVPGGAYFSESGFELQVVGRQTAIPVSPPSGYGPFAAVSWNNANVADVRGLSSAGVANAGTRLMIQFNSVPTGAQIFVPNRINLINQASTSTVTGFAVLANTDANGAGSFSASTIGNTARSGASDVGPNAWIGLSAVSLTAGTGVAVYEILFTDPFNNERLNVPVAVAFAANPGNNLPAPGVQATATGTFAPLSNVGTASDTAPIPRFAPGSTPANAFIINKCSCNILFPFVSNQAGFDTGIAISNTSLDPFGTTPQAGFVTINYYNAGTPPPKQKTNATVPAGDTLAFTLSGGGNYGITATPGFQGYIIAQAEFQFCHGFGYLSGLGQPYSGEGYLGIILDIPGLTRTKQQGEVQAH